MKTKLIIAGLMTILIIGCSSSVDFMKYVEDTYPSTSSVEVLRMKPVNKEFIELGELSLRVKKSNQDEAVLLLKEKAKEIGADAILLLGEDSQGNVIVPIGDLYVSVNKRYIKAVAIKYKN